MDTVSGLPEVAISLPLPDGQCYRARWTNQTICSPQKLPLVRNRKEIHI